ncbi:MAG: hydroxylamine reductase, partial [Planctomycetes bacterium]|nr:hydroxylamine reductase [Planctomycetota bacterium]
MTMFCYQCEQTANQTGCTVRGVCGKEPDVAAMQDLLVSTAKGLGQLAHRLKRFGVTDRQADVFIIEALFSTVTNVNFDADRIEQLLHQARQHGERLVGIYQQECRKAGTKGEGLYWQRSQLADTREGLLQQARLLQIDKRKTALGEDVVGLQELITYGLKGAAAYADHAQILGVADDEVFAAFNEVLSYLADNPTDVNTLTAMAMRVGELNLKAMELLDEANTKAYGHPEPTKVRVTPVAGKCIVVSGHDLKDLQELLKQTAGRGVN